MSDDIVERLRAWVYTDSLYATAKDAADEIERLRHRVRFMEAVIRSGDVATLTHAEREAVETAIGVLGGDDGTLADCSDIVAALRGLLERMG